MNGGQEGKGGKGVDVPFDPPPGTRAARREELARKHPELYASRHVVLATGKVLFGLLGLGALIKLLISLVPWPSVRLPDIDPPSVPWPDVPWPDIPVPDITLPAWLSAILATTKFWVPILIAAVMAVREAKCRRRQREAQPEEQPGTPADVQAEEIRSDRH